MLTPVIRRASLFLVLVFSALAGHATQAIASDGTEPAAIADAKLQELESERGDTQGRPTEQLDRREDSSRREKLMNLLDEIERRMTGSQQLYVSRLSRMTEEMAVYYARMMRKIEDCGTINFPRVKGRAVYGKGSLVVTLDREGKVLSISILETSGKKGLDKHMSKVVRAAAPFGPVPIRALVDSERPFQQLLVSTGFNFVHGDAPPRKIDDRNRCRWR